MNESNAISDETIVDTGLNNYHILSFLLVLLPATAIFGNVLVIVAVYKERTLKTVTNLLIVSLAVSDFLVALCVMSFAIYFELHNLIYCKSFQLNSFVWNLGPIFCNIYLAADVSCSTASILNLFAISLDRYIAISYPIKYAQYGTKRTRAHMFIAFVWGLSIAVGLPILLGVNAVDNTDVWSSIFNFLS
ncbi:unnamed protein product [Dracunculus medinensis]|uniref:G_PROTEIN_RECEP_F1_2 domain-containing protein n=1 Tax=Dracunculus medinensis TaxID=318479 RepID=A0A0N4U6T4_DRAME|nr:unnamed protein product [Dracunculus medinensis]